MSRVPDAELKAMSEGRVIWSRPRPEVASELLRLRAENRRYRKALLNCKTMAHGSHPSPQGGLNNILGIATRALAKSALSRAPGRGRKI